MCYARRVTHFRMKGLRRLRDASAARCCSSDFFREAAAALRRAGGTKFVLPAPAWLGDAVDPCFVGDVVLGDLVGDKLGPMGF